ncbi:hypothetical protein EJB05_10681, partial [Eragrostis curvula]
MIHAAAGHGMGVVVRRLDLLRCAVLEVLDTCVQYVSSRLGRTALQTRTCSPARRRGTAWWRAPGAPSASAPVNRTKTTLLRIAGLRTCMVTARRSESEKSVAVRRPLPWSASHGSSGLRGSDSDAQRSGSDAGEVVFNNAGVSGVLTPVPISALDPDFDRVMAVNARAVVASVKHAARVMVPRRGGSIICTVSTAGVLGGVAIAPYTVLKMAVVGVVRAVAGELGHYNGRRRRKKTEDVRDEAEDCGKRSKVKRLLQKEIIASREDEAMNFVFKKEEEDDELFSIINPAILYDYSILK